MVTRFVLFGGLAAALVACGGQDEILLELSSSRLAVPVDLDSVVVRSHGVGESTPRLEVSLDLSATRTFPIDVLLQPSDGTPTTLVHDIDCFLGESLVCSLSVTHAWASGNVSRVRVSLDAP